MGTDLLFGHPSFKAALNYYKHVPVYFYLYDVLPRVPIVSMFGVCPHLKGKRGDFVNLQSIFLQFEEAEDPIYESYESHLNFSGPNAKPKSADKAN